MDLILDEHQRMLQQTAKRLAHSLTISVGMSEGNEWWQDIAAAGLPGLLVGEAAGGLGLGAKELVLVMQAFGLAGAKLPIAEALVAARLLDKTAETERLAHVLAGDDMLLAVPHTPWWTHDPAHPFIQGFPASASSNGYVVATGNSAQMGRLAIAAPSSVEMRAQVDGSQAGAIAVASTLLSEIARGPQIAGWVDEARQLLEIGAGAELVAIAEASIELTLSHLRLREQFGRPLGANQALQHRVADLFVAVEVDKALIWRVAGDFDAGNLSDALLAAAKARTSRTALRVVREMLQMHGALGYTDSHPSGHLYKRAVVVAARYGDELLQTTRFSDLTTAIAER